MSITYFGQLVSGETMRPSVRTRLRSVGERVLFVRDLSGPATPIAIAH